MYINPKYLFILDTIKKYAVYTNEVFIYNPDIIESQS